MSLTRHRPILRFESHEKAQVVANSATSNPVHVSRIVKDTTSMKRKGGIRRRRSTSKRRTTKRGTRVGRGKPRVVKGRVQVRVAGYSGVQKLAPSTLIPFLPVTKIKAAAKRALAATGKRKTVKRKRRTTRRK